MSDQFPPPAQPTPGSGPTGGQPGRRHAPAAAHRGVRHARRHHARRPRRRRSRRKKLIIGIIAAVVVLALVAGAAVVAVVALSGPDEHTLTITKTAGGMDRDSAKETELKTQLDAAEKQFETQAKKVSYVRSGVYDQDDSERGPEGRAGLPRRQDRRPAGPLDVRLLLPQAGRDQRLQDREDRGRRGRRPGGLRLPGHRPEDRDLRLGDQRHHGRARPDRPRLRQQAAREAAARRALGRRDHRLTRARVAPYSLP